jgi:hypothetical protein
LLLCLVVTACGGGGNDPTTQQASVSPTVDSLIQRTSVQAGSACAEGGQQLAFGEDLNADGVLQASEITGISYACSHNGVAALATAPLPVNAGNATCPNGGSRVVSGLDSDGSAALLHADEAVNVNNATKITYACRGLPGGSSTTGSAALLVASEVVFPGSVDFPAGGTAIITGRNIDGTGRLRNADGSFNAANVLNVTYVANTNTDRAVFINLTGAAQQMTSNLGYMAANESAQVVLTLPAAPQVGDVVRIVGSGQGGWRVAQNEGQSINLQGLSIQPSSVQGLSAAMTAPGISAGLTGGSGDSVTLVYTGNGQFAVQSSAGSGIATYGATSSTPASPPANSASAPGGSASSTANPTSLVFRDLTKTYGDAPFQILPPSQSGTFNYVVRNPDPPVAQISGNTVTVVGAGVATLTATDTSTGQSATATLTVNKAVPTLQLPQVNVQAITAQTSNAYQPFKLQAQTNSPGVVTYTLSNLVKIGTYDNFVADLSSGSDGQTYLNYGWTAGTGTIVTTLAPTANYLGAVVSTQLVVAKGPTLISPVAPISGSSQYAFIVPISYSLEPTADLNTRPATLSISDPTIADVSVQYLEDSNINQIYIAPKKGGSATLTLTVLESANMASATQTIPIALTQAVVWRTPITLQSFTAPNSGDSPQDFQFNSQTGEITISVCTTRDAPIDFKFSGFPGQTGAWHLYFDDNEFYSSAMTQPLYGDYYYTVSAASPTQHVLKTVLDEFIFGGVQYPAVVKTYNLTVIPLGANDRPYCALTSGGE